jgi:hypothetical protein
MQSRKEIAPEIPLRIQVDVTEFVSQMELIAVSTQSLSEQRLTI